MLEWADVIFVMDDDQARLGRMFPDDASVTAHLPGHPRPLPFLDPELVALLRERTRHLDQLAAT